MVNILKIANEIKKIKKFCLHYNFDNYNNNCYILLVIQFDARCNIYLCIWALLQKAYLFQFLEALR